jgi:hypothetical protein
MIKQEVAGVLAVRNNADGVYQSIKVSGIRTDVYNASDSSQFIGITDFTNKIATFNNYELQNAIITDPKIKNGSTGAGSAALGANCPATTLTAPYSWLKMLAPDGSVVYVPAWK